MISPKGTVSSKWLPLEREGNRNEECYRGSLYNFCYNALFLNLDVWCMVILLIQSKLFPSHFSNSQIICSKESNSNSFHLPSVRQKLLNILAYLIFLKT